MNAPCDSAPNVPCGCTLLSALTVSLCNFLSYAMTWQKQMAVAAEASTATKA